MANRRRFCRPERRPAINFGHLVPPVDRLAEVEDSDLTGAKCSRRGLIANRTHGSVDDHGLAVGGFYAIADGVWRSADAQS